MIVTDTRSWREFPRGDDEAPDLLSSSQMVDQIGGMPPTNGRALLVILSTNAPPVQPIRSAAVHSALANAAEHFPDVFEAWEFPSSAAERLFDVITDELPRPGGERRGPVMLLSGDVHTGFSSRMLWKGKTRFMAPLSVPQPITAVIAQFVGSSFREQTGKTINFHNRGYDYAPFGTKWLVPDHMPESYVGWNLNIGQKEKIGRTITTSGSVAFVLPTSINGPTTLRANGRTGGVTEILQTSRDPDYTYRLDYLTATNLGVPPSVPPPIPPTPTGTAADRKKAAEAFDKATGSYRVYIKGNATKQEMIGLNNIGEITFDWGTGDAKTATHTLRFRDSTTNLVLFASYIVNLDPNDPAFPDRTRRAQDPMSASLLGTLAQEVVALLSPITRAARSEEARAALLAQLGVIAGDDDAPLVATLQAMDDLVSAVRTLAAQDTPSFETVTAVLDAAIAFTLIGDVSTGGGPFNGVEGLARDLVNLLAAIWLGSRHPIAREVAALLTLLKPRKTARRARRSSSTASHVGCRCPSTNSTSSGLSI